MPAPPDSVPDIRAGHFIAVTRNMQSEQPGNSRWSASATELALPGRGGSRYPPRRARSPCAATPVGGFGSVTTNKLIASFVGELFNSRSGLPETRVREGAADDLLPTVAHDHVRSHSELDHVEFIP